MIVNLVTPLDREGKVDAQALTWLIRRVRGEVDAVLAGSLEIGEALHLTMKDRLLILETALKAVGKTTPLIFEVTARSGRSTIGFVDKAEALLKERTPQGGFFYLLTPLVFHSNRDLPDFLKKLGRRTSYSFILSNNPDLVRTMANPSRHKNIRTHVLKGIAVNDQVVGLEYRGDLTRAVNFQRALKSRNDFRFYDGSEKNFMARPSSSGLISSGANLLPQAWADIVNSSLDIFESRRMHHEYLSRIWSSGRTVKSLMDLYRKNEIAFIKKALELMGVVPQAAVAAKGARLKPADEERLKAALENFDII